MSDERPPRPTPPVPRGSFGFALAILVVAATTSASSSFAAGVPSDLSAAAAMLRAMDATATGPRTAPVEPAIVAPRAVPQPPVPQSPANSTLHAPIPGSSLRVLTLPPGTLPVGTASAPEPSDADATRGKSPSAATRSGLQYEAGAPVAGAAASPFDSSKNGAGPRVFVLPDTGSRAGTKPSAGAEASESAALPPAASADQNDGSVAVQRPDDWWYNDDAATTPPATVPRQRESIDTRFGRHAASHTAAIRLGTSALQKVEGTLGLSVIQAGFHGQQLWALASIVNTGKTPYTRIALRFWAEDGGHQNVRIPELRPAQHRTVKIRLRVPRGNRPDAIQVTSQERIAGTSATRRNQIHD
jgi:hypothetical protein